MTGIEMKILQYRWSWMWFLQTWALIHVFFEWLIRGKFGGCVNTSICSSGQLAPFLPYEPIELVWVMVPCHYFFCRLVCRVLFYFCHHSFPVFSQCFPCLVAVISFHVSCCEVMHFLHWACLDCKITLQRHVLFIYTAFLYANSKFTCSMLLIMLCFFWCSFLDVSFLFRPQFLIWLSDSHVGWSGDLYA